MTLEESGKEMFRMKNEYQIEYKNEYGKSLTSRVFATDEEDVRKIFQRIFGDPSEIEAIIKHERKEVDILDFD